MKRLVFGCTLLLGGIIGYVGWTIACVNKYTGGWSRVWFCSQGMENIPEILFIIMFLAGLVISIYELKNDKN